MSFLDESRTREKGLWHVFNTGLTADGKQEECYTFGLLVSTISESILSRVIDATSAKDVSEKLRKLYASTDGSIIVAIDDEIHRYKYSGRSCSNANTCNKGSDLLPSMQSSAYGGYVLEHSLVARTLRR
jgi:hypothetical protein